MPRPLGDAEARAVDGFAGWHAFNAYVTQFHTPHPGNSRENGRIRHWIASQLHEFQQQALDNKITIDVIANDTTKTQVRVDWFLKDEYWFCDSRNVMARIHGSDPDNGNQTILLNAHFDSVPTSYGVTDNGISVAVLLELVRYYTTHQPKHTIIFLFNNLEEGGLIGAHTFAAHPWFNTVNAFVNLEGSGAGGRALLFRSNYYTGVRQLARSAATFVHGSPLGNDMLKRGLIKSDTDYSVFTEHNVPGLDIAFYGPRSMYHTPRDSLTFIKPSAVQYMGEVAMGVVRSLDQLGVLPEPADEPVIYYDFLGRYMVVVSFTAYQVLNVLALLAAPLVGIFLGYKKRPQDGVPQSVRAYTWDTLQGFGVAFIIFVSMVLSLAIASALMMALHPLVTYASLEWVIVYLSLTAWTTMVGIVAALHHFPKTAAWMDAEPEILMRGMNAIWWLLVLLAYVLGTVELSAFYYAIYFLVFGTLASVILQVVDASSRFRIPVAFLVQFLVPFVFMIQLIDLGMISLRHSTVDGSSETMVYLMPSLAIVLAVFSLLYWVQKAGHHKQALKVSLVFLALSFVICLVAPRFDTEQSPNKIVYHEEYNATAPTSTVTLRTAHGVDTIRSILDSNELETFQCLKDHEGLDVCTYNTVRRPVYATLAPEEEHAFQWQKKCKSGTCTVQGTFSTKNTLICRIAFEQHASSIQSAWINQGEVLSNVPVGALISYTDGFGKVVPWGITFAEDAPPPRGRFSCFYDEWINGELPAFLAVRDGMSMDAIPLIRGEGLAMVHYRDLDF
ncbi:hypothetical protein BC940DRAFT_231632 [Gongronella butleri]|nr:hypothetical protein BC940DRAFT_231632 [Gongronella butleri]